MADRAQGRDARNLYYQIVESAEDMAIISMDLDSGVTSWNPGAERLLGYSEDEIAGTSADVIFTEEDRGSREPDKERQTALREGRSVDERWHQRKDGTRFWGSGLMMPLKDHDGQVVGFMKMFRDRTREYEQEENRKLLMRELNHRVKNIIAMVHAMAFHLLRAYPSIEQFEWAFIDRLKALGRAHDLLVGGNWRGASLYDVLKRTLEAYAADPARVTLVGPAVMLGADAAVALHAVFYELATNAVKYGALSVEGGRVTIGWRVDRAPRESSLIVDWVEQGGPPVLPPRQSGFGTRLIRQTAQQLSGEVTVSYEPEGVHCHIRVSVDGAMVDDDG